MSVLAYVFWHCRRASIAAPAYEAALVRFHKILETHRPPGFVESRVFRLSAAPWLAPDLAAYEDWYLVQDFAALDALNTAAVSAPRKADHDQAAAYAGQGAAGLYRLKAGADFGGGEHWACWHAKADGQSYDAYYANLADVTRSPHTALWGRQMVLGPTPEFCLRTQQRWDMAASHTLAVERLI